MSLIVRLMIFQRSAITSADTLGVDKTWAAHTWSMFTTLRYAYPYPGCFATRKAFVE